VQDEHVISRVNNDLVGQQRSEVVHRIMGG
jgi:hypothetical protein